jgi:FkbM family methyltransferase
VERPGPRPGLTGPAATVTRPKERPVPKALDFLARSSFRVGKLEPFPGWQFGQWDRKDYRAWVRRLIWQLARSRNYDGPITTDWYFGLRFNHHLTGDVSRCTYVDARYEPNEMYAMAGMIGPGMCVVDAGANEGIFTLIAAHLVGAGGQVHAFEPSPRERTRLLANLALNGLSNVKVHPTALGRAPGRAILRVAERGHPGHNTIGSFAYTGTALESSVEVDVVTLDQTVKELDLRRLDLLKIDVEGSETAVLQGADEVLRTLRPVVVAEAQDASLRQMGSNVPELLAVLRRHNYEVRVFGPSGTAEPLMDDRVTGLNLLCRPR